MPNPLYLRPGSRLPWPVLRPVGDRKYGQSISINRQICVIGARARVHLPLESSLISRTHAIVINDREETYVRDLASTNRVYLNGSIIREARLSKADLLRIGPFTFFCHTGFPTTADLAEADAGGPSERSAIVVQSSKQRYPIHGRTLLIGQRAGCDLVLDKALVSKTHAIVYQRDGKRFIRDLNSTAGTFVNERKVREIELRAGDEIRIGVAILRFESETIKVRAEEGTQLRLMDRDDAGSMMSATDASISRILSTSASFGGASLGGQTIGTASLGCLTMPGGVDLPPNPNGSSNAKPQEFGFSSGVVPFIRTPAEGGASVSHQGHGHRSHRSAPGHRAVKPTAANLRGLLDKFAPAIESVDSEQMPSPHAADVRPPAHPEGVIIPSFDGRSSSRSSIGNAPPLPPTDLRCIEMATADDLFSTSGPAPAPSNAKPPCIDDLLEDAFLREFGP